MSRGVQRQTWYTRNSPERILLPSLPFTHPVSLLGTATKRQREHEDRTQREEVRVQWGGEPCEQGEDWKASDNAITSAGELPRRLANDPTLLPSLC